MRTPLSRRPMWSWPTTRTSACSKPSFASACWTKAAQRDPELDLARVRKWIDQLNADMPSTAHDQLRYEVGVAADAVERTQNE